MHRDKIQKPIIYYIATTIALTILWNVALRLIILPTQYVKSQVRVVELTSKAPNISGGGRQVTTYPTYEYTAIDGSIRTLESNDGFNRYNGILFEKHKGQLITAYLDKNNADTEPFITNTGDWLILLSAPLIFAVLPFGLIFWVVLYFINKKR